MHLRAAVRLGAATAEMSDLSGQVTALVGEGGARGHHFLVRNPVDDTLLAIATAGTDEDLDAMIAALEKAARHLSLAGLLETQHLDARALQLDGAH